MVFSLSSLPLPKKLIEPDLNYLLHPSTSEKASSFIKSSYTNDFVKLSESYNKYIVSPLNNFGLGGFVFDVEGETEMIQESVITDNYVEDNTTRQDNIGIRPLEIRLKRYVGELVFEEEINNIIDTTNKITQTINLIDGLLPTVTQTLSQIKSIFEEEVATNIENFTDVGTNLWSLVKNLNPTATKQQKAYLYLTGLQEQKILVGLQTPFGFYNNMAIKTIKARQGERSKFISEFEITLKQIKTAYTTLIKFDKKAYKKMVANQITKKKEQGKTNGVKVSEKGESVYRVILRNLFKSWDEGETS